MDYLHLYWMQEEKWQRTRKRLGCLMPSLPQSLRVVLWVPSPEREDRDGEQNESPKI